MKNTFFTILVALLLANSLWASGAATAGPASGPALTSAGVLPAPGPITLEQALDAALERASLEDARVGLAYGQLHYLRSKRKWKVEFRPHLGMLAFSNPALLAANIGAGFLAHRHGRPDMQALRRAEFDVLSSEVANERNRMEVRVETARAFFALLEKQQDEERAWALLERRRQGRERMAGMLNASRVTLQDQTLFEAGLANLEVEMVDAEAQRKAAAVELARLIGYPGKARELRVTGESLEREWKNASLGLESLMELAIARRGELNLLRDKLDELPPGPSIDKKFRFDQFFGGYSHISDSVGSQLGVKPEGYILGGHTGRADLGFAINLRPTGEKKASAEINAARRRVLELELESAGEAVRAEVETVWHLHQANLRKLAIAARRRDLLAKMMDAIQVRTEHGLSTPAALLSAEMDVLRQENYFSEAVSDRRTTEFHLRTVCGADDDEQLTARTELNSGDSRNDD